ncbi:hypothetical protein [Streptomyces sp. SID3212]|uniref:hypothetical protein n=1 Tax=Streptomyces sp. SID3212 TaxID=2690259 RepID=UPI00136B032F|nr:hypothetical protein [Streptomyces sp. SID3212]MYV54791.1 hypothetical protein [Streptomyces sp. SID3212]
MGFAPADDPDAVVRLRIDGRAGTREGRSCEDALDEAVERGRAGARELRRLIQAFGRRGHGILAVSPGGTAPWIATALTDATIARGLAEVGAGAVGAPRPGRRHAVRHGWNRHRPSETTSTSPPLTRRAVSSSTK